MNNTNAPQFQFFPLTGQPYNQLIQLGGDCCEFLVMINASTNVVALWLHWQQFSVVTKDIDGLNATGFPGLFVGTSAIYKQTALLANDGLFYAVKYRAPFIKLKKPVGFFYVTGWTEAANTGTVGNVDGAVTIIATNDLEDAYIPLTGGQ